MTVDVEDYFQVEAYARVIPRSSWDKLVCRVEANVQRILELFDKHHVSGTFFTLGWIAERHPGMVRRIVDAGHELASHGYGHERVDRMSPESFREDLARARGVLEEIAGAAVIGYRAPTFSLRPSASWAFDALADTGHIYSSSIYPIHHDLYGSPDAPRFSYQQRPGLWEFPMTTCRIGTHNFPCSGGGYFRLLPYRFYQAGLRRVNGSDCQPGIFYFHPWEIDPDQPRVAGSTASARFRHTVNLRRMEPRLTRALSEFRWGRMDEVFAEHLGRHAGCAR